MVTVFNILIIVMIALIAYWWASQGFFSAILHLVCVICAGGIALALWEPFTHAILSDAWYAPLVPGTILLLTFSILLALMRFATDKIAPGNVRLPQSTDMACGAVAGAASGVLTIGLLIIGCGFIHRPLEFMGYTGWARDAQGVVSPPDSALWLPVDVWTTDFYEYLSLSTMYPDMGGAPLAQLNPRIDRLSSLVRDTAHTEKGKSGQSIQNPGTVKVDAPFSWMPEGERGRYLTVPVTFTRKGLDYGRELLLSNAQVRLVGTNNGTIVTAHPRAWGQNMDKDGTRGFYIYDSPTRYASSVGGIAETPVKLVFTLDEGFEPEFIQIRGTRFDLPTAQEADSEQEFLDRAWAMGQGAGGTWGTDITALADTRGRFDRTVRPLRTDFQGDYEVDDESQMLVRSNYARIKKSKGLVRSKLSVRGYMPPQMDTSVFKIDVSPGSHADIIAASRETGGDGAMSLEDTEGRAYVPIGYEHVGDNHATVTYNEPIEMLSDVRARPRQGTTDKLYLIFAMPVGTSPAELFLDNVSIGYLEGITIERTRGF